MAFVHGKGTIITIDGDDISAFTTTSELDRQSDEHDVTTYGKNSHVFQGGLLTGEATVSGIYDNTAATGPRAVLEPLIGTVVPLVRKPEGTGTGKPMDTVNVLVKGYKETNPVADMVTWEVSLRLSDDVASTSQS